MMCESERSRLQIYFSVLNAIRKGAQKPTTIMQDANVSWKTLFEVFTVLTSKGLIKSDYQECYKRYSLTKKGLIAATHYGKALGFIDDAKEAQTIYA